MRHSGQQGQCRIIAGKWRGRHIHFDDAEGLRPTTDRIRETVFNWLQLYLPRSRCLDCFAGSGVLGFEALSRGAASVVFIERNKTTLQNIRQNATQLQADGAEFVQQDARRWLADTAGLSRGAEPFDIVFLDPPFRTGLLQACAESLDQSGCLAEDAIIYVEHAVDEDVILPENWICLKQKQAGQVMYQLFQKQMKS